MSSRDCKATFAERQVVTTVVASRHAAHYVDGIVTADHFSSIMNRRLFLVGMERDAVELQEERVAALAAASGWHERDLWTLLDAPDRLCHVDASRFARRVVECAAARVLAAVLVDIHEQLRHGADIEKVRARLRMVVA